jgi:hypothetical protein
MVSGHVLQDVVECSQAERVMVRNGKVMLPILLGGLAHVGALLTREYVAQTPKGPGQSATGDISGQPHRANTSSRTKWRRMIRGAGMVASK